MLDEIIRFRAQLWVWTGDAGWHFVTLPKEDADSIRFMTAHARRGFGSLRVKATVGKTSWSTSIFPDGKSGSYLLPVKADVRRAEKVRAGDEVDVTIRMAE